MMSRSGLPLDGVRVVEFCQILAGPFAACLLADMGADVIKIEAPEGDAMRQWAPLREDYSQYFASLNRNKRSVALDLKDEEGRQAAEALAASADIVLENFRPGVLARFGLDYESLCKKNPALVYCSISAYGQTGPRAGEGGFDVTLQAISGLMSVTGTEGGPPVKCGLPLADTTAGLYAAFSSAAALHRAKACGRGEYIDISMLGGMLSTAHLQTSELFALGRDPVRLGSAHPMNAPYAAFRCRDGHFVLAAGTDALWQKTCDVIRRPDLAQDPRFATAELRGRNQAALTPLLEEEFVLQDAGEWVARFACRGVPSATINTYSQALSDPQVEHAGLVAKTELPNGVSTRTVLSPQRLSGEGLGIYRSPPALGEHTDEVLHGLAENAQGPENPRRFRDFLADFTRLVETGPAEETVLERGAALLADLVAVDDWLPDGSAQPHPDRYGQYLLYCDPLDRFSVVSFVWGPGQETPVHDHTVWGLVGVLRGMETSQRFRPGEGQGLIAEPVAVHHPGHVERVSPRIGDIHRVANGHADRVSVSIHVYGGNIGTIERHSYDAESGEARPFVSGYSTGHMPAFWCGTRSVRNPAGT